MFNKYWELLYQTCYFLDPENPNMNTCTKLKQIEELFF